MSSGQSVFIVHHVVGRVRLCVEPLRRDGPRAERVEGLARSSPWVVGARANPWTASLIVEYDDGVPLEAVLAGLARIPELAECGELGLEELARPPARAAGVPPHPARTAGFVLKAAERVNAASSALATPHADLKLLVPGALVGYGLFCAVAGRGSATPAWLTLMKYGFDTFVVLNQGAIRGFLHGALAPAAGGVSP
jgi:hypothetical protein